MRPCQSAAGFEPIGHSQRDARCTLLRRRFVGALARRLQQPADQRSQDQIVQRAEVLEAQLRFRGHAPVVVDVRSASAREIDPRRVPGSVVVDIADLDARLGDLPPDRDIILYCT